MGALNFPALDAAIAKAEGFGIPGNIPTLANNPGDLIAGPFATAHGATGAIPAQSGQMIATFPDVATGTAATDALISSKYAGGTVADLSQGWLAGSDPTIQANWANTVASAIGGTPSTPVGATPPFLPSASSTWWQNFINGVAPGMGTLGGFATSGLNPAIPGTNLSWGRVAAFLIGLLFIAAGLAGLAFIGVGRAADVVLGGHEQVRRVTRAAAVLK